MALKEIAQWIEDHSAWVIGTNFFYAHLPLKRQAGTVPPKRKMLILENAPGALEPDLPDRIDKPTQFLNYSNIYTEARDDAYGIFTLIHGTAGWNLPVLVVGETYLAMVVDAVGSPAPIENPDEKGIFIFSTNYIWRLEKATC